MADLTDPNVDLDELLALNDDDVTVTTEEPEPTPEPEAKVKRTRAPRRTKEPEEVVAEPGHVPTETINPTESALSPEQQRIAQLRAELSKPVLKPTTDETGRPLPETQLDEEQRQIRELEDALAKRNAEAIVNTEPSYVKPTGKGEIIYLHFLKDGLLVNGTTTYKGQEMEFEVGSVAYKQTQNRNGESFLDILDDVDAQFDRWGEQYIARGPWRGRAWGDTSKMTDPQQIEAARAAAQQEARRGRSAPVFAH
jgi:hypothetical protein